MEGKVACFGIAALMLYLNGGCSYLPSVAEPSSLTQVDFSTLPPCADDDCNCDNFRDQASAQAVLEALPNDPFVLDQDANGLACETLPAIAPPVTGSAPPSADMVHLVLGNPTNASSADLNNYLLLRSPYALSYNSQRGTANWVSWQLSADWLGDVPRQDNFRQDGGLPAGVYQVTPNDYLNTGYDRGHLVPSGDRTRSVQDNAATFLMTNILPQAPSNNRGSWRELEEYSRDLVYQLDRTLLVMTGGYGKQAQLASGRVTVPSRLWKIIVVLEVGQSVEDIDGNTLVIAVDMPNRDEIDENWRTYQTTIDRIELATGYDFLSTVPENIQTILESSLADTALTMAR